MQEETISGWSLAYSTLQSWTAHDLSFIHVIPWPDKPVTHCLPHTHSHTLSHAQLKPGFLQWHPGVAAALMSSVHTNTQRGNEAWYTTWWNLSKGGKTGPHVSHLCQSLERKVSDTLSRVHKSCRAALWSLCSHKEEGVWLPSPCLKLGYESPMSYLHQMIKHGTWITAESSEQQYKHLKKKCLSTRLGNYLELFACWSEAYATTKKKKSFQFHFEQNAILGEKCLQIYFLSCFLLRC